MSIKEQISGDLKNAMRAKDKQKLGTLRLINSAIKQIEVDERIEVDDERMLVVLDKLAKQRKESIEQFKSAGRQDLVGQEQFELDVIKQYLPEPLSDEAVKHLVDEAIQQLNAQAMSDMGKVMAHIKPTLQGRADIGKVSALVKAKLGPVDN